MSDVPTPSNPSVPDPTPVTDKPVEQDPALNKPQALPTKTNMLAKYFGSDSFKRGVRTFVISFLTLLIPGLLGWLNDLTSWANGHGSTPFPDARGLLYIVVAAIVAGFVAVVNLIWNWVEDQTGVKLLRK